MRPETLHSGFEQHLKNYITTRRTTRNTTPTSHAYGHGTYYVHTRYGFGLIMLHYVAVLLYVMHRCFQVKSNKFGSHYYTSPYLPASVGLWPTTPMTTETKTLQVVDYTVGSTAAAANIPKIRCREQEPKGVWYNVLLLWLSTQALLYRGILLLNKTNKTIIIVVTGDPWYTYLQDWLLSCVQTSGHKLYPLWSNNIVLKK